LTAEARVEADFLAEISSCEASLALLNQRVHAERQQWDDYWSEHFFDNAAIIQSWFRGLRGRERARRQRETLAAKKIQAVARAHWDRLRWIMERCALHLQSWIRKALAEKFVVERRRRYNKAAVQIETMVRGWVSRQVYQHMIDERDATAAAIYLDHLRHESSAKIQRQFRRHARRRRDFRIRAVVHAAYARKMHTDMPGRFDLSSTSVEEELDATLREFREWNPRPHHSKHRRPKTPEVVLSIRRDRNRKLLHHEEMKKLKLAAEKKPTFDELMREELEEEGGERKEGEENENDGKPPKKEKIVRHKFALLRDNRDGHTYKPKKKKKHHAKHEKLAPPRPTFTAIVDSREMDTLWRGKIIEYQVRWKGTNGKLTWIPRSVMVEPELFPESSLTVLREYETFDAARKAHVSRGIVEKAATRVQTFVRGFLAQNAWSCKKVAVVLIQTTLRACHNLLEPRRQRLLAARYEQQMEAENQRYREEAERARAIGHKVEKSEMNCLLDEVMEQLQKHSGEPEADTRNRHGCLPIRGGWCCTGRNCGYENEPLQGRCDLCLKLKPRERKNEFY
jgi:hypothetical protein